MKTIQSYINEVIGNDLLSSKVKVLPSQDGFYSRMIRNGNEFRYEIYVPENKQKLRFFNEMFYKNPTQLRRLMDKIRQHRIFYFLQGVWYWNPFIRKIKKKLGFSTTIQYSKDDLYDKAMSEHYTRQSNEAFCDYFALFIQKSSKFLLDK